MKNDLGHTAMSTEAQGAGTDHEGKGYLSPCLTLGRTVLLEKDVLKSHKVGVCLEWKGKREGWK